MIDLRPAADRTAEVVAGIGDEHLALPTPCGASVGDLLDHLGMFARNFAAVAAKQLDEGTSTPPPSFDARHLGADWRPKLRGELDALAVAWSTPEAWDGSTWVAGMLLPAETVGVIALDELVVHGWDLAAATGQPYAAPDEEIAAATGFVTTFDAPRTGELFGPVVGAPADASPLEQLLALTGRDPRWRAEP